MVKYSINDREEFLEINLIGDLDIDGTEIFEEELIPMMTNYKFVNLSLEKVPFVDSSGMGLLLNMVHSLTENGIKVTISNIRKEVLDVFELLQIPEILGDGVFI